MKCFLPCGSRNLILMRFPRVLPFIFLCFATLRSCSVEPVQVRVPHGALFDPEWAAPVEKKIKNQTFKFSSYAMWRCTFWKHVMSHPFTKQMMFSLRCFGKISAVPTIWCRFSTFIQSAVITKERQFVVTAYSAQNTLHCSTQQAASQDVNTKAVKTTGTITSGSLNHWHSILPDKI